MNKLTIYLFILTGFSSCQKEEEPTLNAQEVYDTYLEVFNSTFEKVDPSYLLSSHSTSDSKYVIIHKGNLFDKTQNVLKSEYFNDVDYKLEYQQFENPFSSNSKARTSYQINFDTVSILTQDQKNLVEPFVEELLEIEDLNLVSDKVHGFLGEVMLSNLSDEEKMQLGELAAATSSLRSFIGLGE